jgi:serine/threonine protein phosphatase PrpC
MSSTKRTIDAAVLIDARAVVVPSFDFRVDCCAGTLTGRHHPVNQDALLCRPEAGIFGLADGMGGHAAGEVAAAVALRVAAEQLCTREARRVIARYARTPDLDRRREVFALVDGAMHAANRAVREAGEHDEAKQGMGTTLDLLLLVRDRAFLAHVGDARIYLVRPTTTLQLTHDHAMYDSLQQSGKRSPPRRFVRSPLANSIGHSGRVAVDTLFVDLNQGERLIMCTDGVFNALEDEATFTRVCEARDVRLVTRRLLEASDRGDGHDDASVITVGMCERFVARRSDAGPRARDLEVVSGSPLLYGLSPAQVLATLAAAVEIEIEPGKEVPGAVANDRVAYLLLDGLIGLPGGRTLGASALLLAESLVDVPVRGTLPKVIERARLLRIRHDDFS